MSKKEPCPECGAYLNIGDWPFCPHGRGMYANVPDDVPGGFWVENAWSEPRKFYSQSEYETALKADGMELAPRWVPGSKHLTRWAITDPQTLENARILSERQAQTKATQDEAEPLQTFTRMPVTTWEGGE